MIRLRSRSPWSLIPKSSKWIKHIFWYTFKKLTEGIRLFGRRFVVHPPMGRGRSDGPNELRPHAGHSAHGTHAPDGPHGAHGPQPAQTARPHRGRRPARWVALLTRRAVAIWNKCQTFAVIVIVVFKNKMCIKSVFRIKKDFGCWNFSLVYSNVEILRGLLNLNLDMLTHS